MIRTCIVSLIVSLSPKISLKFLVPSTLCRVVCASRRVEPFAFSTFVIIEMVAYLYIRKYITASTATVTMPFVKTCREITQWRPLSKLAALLKTYKNTMVALLTRPSGASQV